MGLAYLKYQQSDRNNHYFLADIGTNSFFQIKIGQQKRRYRGLELIDEVFFTSPILKSERANPILTRFTLPMPHSLFQNRDNYIQLWSYRTPDKLGPALSPVLRSPLRPVNSSHSAIAPSITDIFPNLSLSTTQTAVESYNITNQAFSYQEEGMSESMFWNQLLSALPGIVEKAVPVITQLAGSGSRATRPSATPSASQAGQRNADELIMAIAHLIQSINHSNRTPASSASTPSTTPATAPVTTPSASSTTSQAASFISPPVYGPYGLNRSLAQVAQLTISPDTLNLIQDHPQQMGKVLNDSILRLGNQPRARYDYTTAANYFAADYSTPNYSSATVAWAPIIAAVAPYVKDILELGNKNNAEQHRHLERLVELLNDPALTALMATMSHVPAHRAFIADSRLYIDTDHLPKVALHQKERVVYHHGQALTIPFKLATHHPDPPARPIPKAIVEVTIQDPETMSVLWKKDFRIKNVFVNSMVKAITILPEESQNLPVNTDLKVEIAFLWPGRDRHKVYGVVKNQFVTLVKEAIFDRIGEKVGPSIPLNDISLHRPFWHKVWEGGYTESRRWHIEFDAKYYYAVDFEADEPSRLETRLQIIEDNARPENTSDSQMPGRRKVRARLKSGMELTLEMLNSMLTSKGHPAIAPFELSSFKTPALQNYLNQTARAHLELKGKSGDTATLWVYPELDIHQVHMLRISQTNELGQVLGMEKQTLYFPRPSAIHFIGAISK